MAFIWKQKWQVSCENYKFKKRINKVKQRTCLTHLLFYSHFFVKPSAFDSQHQFSELPFLLYVFNFSKLFSWLTLWFFLHFLWSFLFSFLFCFSKTPASSFLLIFTKLLSTFYNSCPLPACNSKILTANSSVITSCLQSWSHPLTDACGAMRPQKDLSRGPSCPGQRAKAPKERRTQTSMRRIPQEPCLMSWAPGIDPGKPGAPAVIEKRQRIAGICQDLKECLEVGLGA